MNTGLMRAALMACMALILAASVQAQDPPQQPPQKDDKPDREVKLDMVSDTVSQLFGKANAILSGNMEITMSNKIQRPEEYTLNAMGQRVPKTTAIKSGSSLHNDGPL